MWAVKSYFGLEKPPSEATIHRDLKWAREQDKDRGYSQEALDLLKPERFGPFRKLFKAPGGGYYETNRTHHALYWVLYALTRKVVLPDWVIGHFDLPSNVNDDIVEKEKLLTFILLVAPRHGKTMTLVHGLIALICEFPDIAIIYSQGVMTTTQDIMGLIQIEFESNEKLIELYGPFRDDDRQWSLKGFTVARREVPRITPTFLPVGIESNVRSRDADIILIDDPQDLERAESETTTRKDYKKITNEFMQRREPHTPVLMVGSHVPSVFGDVFTKIEDNLDDLQTEGQTIILRKRPAHREAECRVERDGTDHVDCLEWPERRDWKFLMAQKALLDSESPGMYDAVYQQEARIPGSRAFPPEIVKVVRSDGGILDTERSWKSPMKTCPRCEGPLYTTIGFDPASGEGKRASYSALAVLQGCPKDYSLFVLDYWHKRQSPDHHASTIFSFAKSFHPDYVRIEINAYQKHLARDAELLEYSRDPKYGFHIDEWMTDDRKNTPEFGIPKLAKWMREDKFSIPYATWDDEAYAKDIIAAFVRYPGRPDDIPMAVWLAAGMMWEMFELYQDLAPIVLPGRDRNTPAYMIDNPLRINLGDISRQAREDEEYPAGLVVGR